MIQIALNGARPKSDCEFIPNTPLEIIKDVRKLFHAGFLIYHIHIYDKQGKESLARKDVIEIIGGIRNISEKIKIGISTGDWIEPDLSKRIEHVRSWKIIPDFASVNFVEEDSIEIAEELIAKKIKLEAGLTDQSSAEKFIKSGVRNNWIRILLEPQEQNLTDALTTIKDIESILDKNRIPLKCLLHGFNLTAWDLVREAFKRRYDTRIGLEDTIFDNSGKKVSGNLELAKEALRIKANMKMENGKRKM